MSEPGSEEENGARRGKSPGHESGFGLPEKFGGEGHGVGSGVLGLFDKCGQKGRFGGMG